MEVGGNGGLSTGAAQHGLRSLGQTCRTMNTGYQWDQGQEWEGQEVALWGCKRVSIHTGRELGLGEQGAGRTGGVEEGCSACPRTYTFWWSLTRFRRTLICKRNAGGWRPGSMAHAQQGMRVGAKVHHCSLFPSGSCTGL